MKHSNLSLLIGAALLITGFLGGMLAVSLGTSSADASPSQVMKNAVVTGDGTTLTLWKVKDGNVLQATHYRVKGGKIELSHSMPAASATPPKAASGKSCGSCGGGACG